MESFAEVPLIWLYTTPVGELQVLLKSSDFARADWDMRISPFKNRCRRYSSRHKGSIGARLDSFAQSPRTQAVASIFVTNRSQELELFLVIEMSAEAMCAIR